MVTDGGLRLENVKSLHDDRHEVADFPVRAPPQSLVQRGGDPEDGDAGAKVGGRCEPALPLDKSTNRTVSL